MTARWNDFLDRVYGCWLGKCASSGASPARGLDIQILWLDVLMRVGPECTAADLAHAFYAEYSEEDGDYTALRKNCARGLCPPLTATFNNPGGAEDTGCAARAEIWACMAPGDPSLAASLAGTDASVDHTGDAAEAEKYLAALGALAFTGKQDVRGLVVCALEYIDKNTRLYEMAGKVLAWCERRPDRDFVYGRILRDYGHTNCRHVLQNMGFVLLSLLLGGGDYRESVALVRACGFDADSNCVQS